MSISYTLCLLVCRTSFANNLERFGDFRLSNTPEITYDPWPRSRQSLTTSDFLERLRMPSQPVFREEEIFRLGIKYGEGSAVLWLTSEMQKLFQLTYTHKYLLLSLGFDLRKNQDYLPFEHPLMPLILAMTSRLEPIYSWMEADFDGTEHGLEIWYKHLGINLNSFPTSIPPWSLPSSMWIIGKPLSSYVEPYLRPALPNEAQSFVRELKRDLLVITQPGNPESAERFSKSKELVHEDHKAVATDSIGNALENIPDGVLT